MSGPIVLVAGAVLCLSTCSAVGAISWYSLATRNQQLSATTLSPSKPKAVVKKTAVVSTKAPPPTCDYAACDAIIDARFQGAQAFDTKDFSECKGCPSRSMKATLYGNQLKKAECSKVDDVTVRAGSLSANERADWSKYTSTKNVLECMSGRVSGAYNPNV